MVIDVTLLVWTLWEHPERIYYMSCALECSRGLETLQWPPSYLNSGFNCCYSQAIPPWRAILKTMNLVYIGKWHIQNISEYTAMQVLVTLPRQQKIYTYTQVKPTLNTARGSDRGMHNGPCIYLAHYFRHKQKSQTPAASTAGHHTNFCSSPASPNAGDFFQPTHFSSNQH